MQLSIQHIFFFQEIPDSFIKLLPGLSVLAMKENGCLEKFSARQREIINSISSFKINYELSTETSSSNVTQSSKCLCLFFFYVVHLLRVKYNSV